MKVVVVDGDIAQVEADALITAINPAGMWFGGIDRVIMNTAGLQYHDVASRALRLNPDKHVVVAPSNREHFGKFQSVVFVIDDLTEPLNVAIRRGLTVASDKGFETVSMPMIRFGVMLEIGGTVDDKVDDIAMAIHGQSADTKNRIKQLTIVVYDDPNLSAHMRHALHL